MAGEGAIVRGVSTPCLASPPTGRHDDDDTSGAPRASHCSAGREGAAHTHIVDLAVGAAEGEGLVVHRGSLVSCLERWRPPSPSRSLRRLGLARRYFELAAHPRPGAAGFELRCCFFVGVEGLGHGRRLTNPPLVRWPRLRRVYLSLGTRPSYVLHPRYELRASGFVVKTTIPSVATSW